MGACFSAIGGNCPIDRCLYLRIRSADLRECPREHLQSPDIGRMMPKVPLLQFDQACGLVRFHCQPGDGPVRIVEPWPTFYRTREPGESFRLRSEERRVGKECRSRWWAE